MKVKSLTCENFRNLKNLDINAHPNMNLIYGDNAQGKTNIIEALWLFTGQKSFRGSNDRQMINNQINFSNLSLTFNDGRRDNIANIRLEEKKRTVLLNGVKLNSSCSIIGNFYSVVFAPNHLSLASDGPQVRRRFLDAAISQINHKYADYLSNYEKVLEQRNSLLKELKRFPSLDSTLDIWDLQLAKLGTIITIYRNDYINRLKTHASAIYSGFSKESMSIKYQSGVFQNVENIITYTNSNIELFYNRLKSDFEKDVKLKFTGSGIHRDDIDLFVENLYLRDYGSQGQRRSVVLALKLSEAMILKEVCEEQPVILFDDVLSELDIKRQEYLLNELTDFQVFITCCDKANTKRLLNGSVFYIKSGACISDK